MPAYATVFIDWHKTLCHDKFWGHWEDPAHQHSLLFRALSRFLFAEPSPVLTAWMRGELTAEEAVGKVGARIDADPNSLLEELSASCRRMRLVSAEAPALVANLREQGVRVVLATDNTDTFTRWTVPALRLRDIFDDILCSHELGCLKGDVCGECSPFFSPYLARHGTGFGQSLLIDDSASLASLIKPVGIHFWRVVHPSDLTQYLRTLLAEHMLP